MFFVLDAFKLNTFLSNNCVLYICFVGGRVVRAYINIKTVFYLQIFLFSLLLQLSLKW